MSAATTTSPRRAPVRITSVLSTNPSKAVNEYVRLLTISSTTQTQVFTARHSTTNEEVIIKAVKRTNPARDKFQRLRKSVQEAKVHLASTEASIRREIAIMKACSHPNHVQLFEVIDDPAKDKIFLVMEYLRGGKIEWRDDETRRPLFTLDQTRRIFRDLVLALEYLDYMGIVHRDCKPDNIVWRTEDRDAVTLIDYGISHWAIQYARIPFARCRKAFKPLRQPALFPPTDMAKLRGTDMFIAPELVWGFETPSDSRTTLASVNVGSGDPSVASLPDAPSVIARRPPVNKAVDIWSLAVTLYCLLFGRFPFDIARMPHQHVTQAKFRLYQSICTKDWLVPPHMSADKVQTGGRDNGDRASVINLLDRMLQKDPRKRLTLYEIKRHPWVLEGLPDPELWLRKTSPSVLYVGEPFAFFQRLGHGIKSCFKKRTPPNTNTTYEMTPQTVA